MAIGSKASLFSGSSITSVTSSPTSYTGGLFGGGSSTSLFSSGNSGLFGNRTLAPTPVTAPPQSGPQGVDISKQVDEDSGLGLDFVGSDFKVSDATALDSLKIVTKPSNGTLTLDGVEVSVDQIIDVDDFGKLNYVPYADFDGVETFTIAMSTDGSDYDSTPSNVSITVLASDDDAPSIDPVSTIAVEEGAEASNLGALIVASYNDPDSNDELDQVVINTLPANGVLSYTSGAGGVVTLAGAATISAAEAATFVFTANDDNGAGEDTAVTDTVTFDLVDSNGDASASSGTVSIQINDANDAPTIAVAASYSVDEGMTAIAATVNPATDNETPETLNYSITGTDASLFNVDPDNGDLSFKSAPDYEDAKDSNKDNFYRFNLIATDDGGKTAKQAVEVEVENETPLLAVSDTAATIDEGTSVVMTVSPSTNNDPIGEVTYSIDGGADSALFTINDETGVLSFISAPDFEDDLSDGGSNTYVVSVLASIADGDDGAPDSDTATITVTVSDLDDVDPSFIAATTGTGGTPVSVTTVEGSLGLEFSELFAESAGSATNLIDIDFGNGEGAASADAEVTYSMTSSAGTSNFAIDSATGTISIGAEVVLDHETTPEITLTVTVTDDSGATAKTTVEVSVTDDDEKPKYTKPDAIGVDEDGDKAIGVTLWNALSDEDGDAFALTVTTVPTAGTIFYEIAGINDAWAPVVVAATPYTEAEVKSFQFYGPNSDDIPVGTATPSAITTGSFPTSLEFDVTETDAPSSAATALAFDIVVIDDPSLS